MTIGKITSNQIHSTTAPTAATTANSNSKNIQNQIVNKEQHLNRLSSDTKLSAAEKEKKRQEIQKEIDELNRKLELMRMRQEEAEEKAQANQEKAAALKEEALSAERRNDKRVENNPAEKAGAEYAATDKLPSDAAKVSEEERKPVSMPIEDVQKMLTADYALQKELAQKNVDAHRESTVDVIKSEINQDQLRGSDTASKEAEIETIRTKENFWTEEKKPDPVETQPATGMNVNAQITVDSI